MNVEQFATHQRIGIGFAITELNTIGANRGVSLVHDLFLCCSEKPVENHQKKARNLEWLQHPAVGKWLHYWLLLSSVQVARFGRKVSREVTVMHWVHALGLRREAARYPADRMAT